MLSIPVFGDQAHNSIEAESRGFALYVPYFELTAETFGSKLQQLLEDPGWGCSFITIIYIRYLKAVM